MHTELTDSDLSPSLLICIYGKVLTNYIFILPPNSARQRLHQSEHCPASPQIRHQNGIKNLNWACRFAQRDHNSYPNPLPNPPTPPPHNHLTPNPRPNPHYNPHPDPRNHLLALQKGNPRMLPPIRQVINPVFLLRLPLHRALRPLLRLPHLVALIPFPTPQPLLLFPPHTPRRRSQSLATTALRRLVMGPNLLCP